MYSNIDSKELFNIVLGDLQMVIDGELDCLGKEECQPMLELLEEIRTEAHIWTQEYQSIVMILS